VCRKTIKFKKNFTSLKIVCVILHLYNMVIIVIFYIQIILYYDIKLQTFDVWYISNKKCLRFKNETQLCKLLCYDSELSELPQFLEFKISNRNT